MKGSMVYRRKQRILNKFLTSYMLAQITLLAKSVIYVAFSILVVALIYGSSPTFVVVVEGKPTSYDYDCREANFFYETCCWFDDEYKPGLIVYVCQTCYDTDGYGSNGYEDCGSLSEGDPRDRQLPPTPPLTGGKGIFGSNVLPTPSVSLGENIPDDGGILEQPPLFGRNVFPLQGGGFEVLQEPETPPMFGQVAPQVAPLTAGNAPLGVLGQEPAKVTTPTPTPRPTLTPTPIPTPTPTPEPIPVGPDLPPPFPPPTPGFEGPPIATDISPNLAPEDDQDETDEGRNDIPDTGITEQPETQQPEDSPEGAETAGPLT
jgi:hypothetical protein